MASLNSNQNIKLSHFLTIWLWKKIYSRAFRILPTIIIYTVYKYIGCLQDSRETSDELNMKSYICDETKDLIDLSDEELDDVMAEVIYLELSVQSSVQIRVWCIVLLSFQGITSTPFFQEQPDFSILLCFYLLLFEVDHWWYMLYLHGLDITVSHDFCLCSLLFLYLFFSVINQGGYWRTL